MSDWTKTSSCLVAHGVRKPGWHRNSTGENEAIGGIPEADATFGPSYSGIHHPQWLAALLITIRQPGVVTRKMASQGPSRPAVCAGHQQRIGHGVGQSGLLEGGTLKLLRIPAAGNQSKPDEIAAFSTSCAGQAGGHHRHGLPSSTDATQRQHLEAGAGGHQHRDEGSPPLCGSTVGRSSSICRERFRSLVPCRLRNASLGPCQ